MKSIAITSVLLASLIAIAAAKPTLSFQLPNDYYVATGAEKTRFLWKQIEKTEYETMPTYKNFGASIAKDIIGLLPQKLAGAFNNAEDVNVKGRQKLIHKLGSTAWFRFEPLNDGYQSFEGIIRLSHALNPENGILFPSFSVKIPMDNREPSINFHIGKAMDPQKIGNDPKGKPDFNFFRDDKLFPFSNELPLISKTTLGKLFKWVLDRAHLKPNFIPVTSLSRVMNKPAPRRLIFRAPNEIQNLMSSEVYQDERIAMAKIPEGAVLFEMYESTGLGDDGILVGRIVLNSRLIASSFADRNLNFNHDDRDLKKNLKK